MSLYERQNAFGRALLDAKLEVPDGLVGPDGHPSVRRFAVYRNNVVVSLINALGESFPVVRRIVGEAFFKAMAGFYVTKEPPSSPILLVYGAGFADFLSVFPPLVNLPYLADVARIERAWSEAYHAADAPSADIMPLLQIGTEILSDVQLMFHPSVRLVRSRFPALTIWHTNLPDATPIAVDLSKGSEAGLILRPNSEVVVQPLLPGGDIFVRALLDGGSVGQAGAAGFAAESEFEFATNLSALFLSGAIIGWVVR